ncbi:MAG: hypothetical protein IJO45_00725 [Oscillospiraceae bacterium]|nr:hypothetical protein [Oscillospiraceae bacterium]
MKRIVWVVALVVFLCGCGADTLDQAMAMRTQLQSSSGCSFDATITADYGDVLYEFGMQCITDEVGNLSFTVTAPETIAGITGTVNDEGGKLTFDDQALMFELLADGQVTPVSAPWLLIKTLRGGYLNTCSHTDNGFMVIIDDSYEDNALQLDIWVSEDNCPLSAEILYDGRRIVSLAVSNFTYL